MNMYGQRKRITKIEIIGVCRMALSDQLHNIDY